MSIGIAILGAGIFATDEHLPAIQAVPSLTLKAVYSRSAKSAEKLARAAGAKIAVYHDDPVDPSKNLEALLKRTDIHAVSIAVDISKSPDLIQKALSAGKHILSEKPIAPTIVIANDLLRQFKERQNKSTVWAVGENFRLWHSVGRAVAAIKEANAKLLTFRCTVNHFIGPEDKYFHADWRQSASHPAGYVLDACIHFVAVARYLLAASGHTITSLSAHTKQIHPTLKPIDSVFAVMQTDGNFSGTFTFSVGVPTLDEIEYDIITDKGNVCLRGPHIVTTRMLGSSGELIEKTAEDPMTFGVKEEFVAFAEAVSGGLLDPRISVEEAYADLQLLECLLTSGEQGGGPQKVPPGIKATSS